MDLQLKDKTVLITGSTAGIGFATAKSLLNEGARVIINGRNKSGIKETIEKIKLEIPEADVDGISADFSKFEDVQNLLNQLPYIDILINNVGIYQSQDFFEMVDDDWYKQFEVNVMSGVRLSRQYLSKMLEKGWGRIIFVSSECASLVPNDLIAYSMTKAAVHAVSRGLSQLTKGTDVTVNTVMPGSTLSEGAQQFLKGVAEKEGKTESQVEKDFFSEIRTSSLIQRFASVEEVAHTITYLVSPLSSATNGASIKIDGGSTGGIF